MSLCSRPEGPNGYGPLALPGGHHLWPGPRLLLLKRSTSQ